MVTPGISLGYWKARKRPRRARSSGLKFQKIFAVHQNFSRDYAVIGMSGQNLGQRAFPRAVWAHQCVHFASRNTEGKAAHNFLIADGDS